MTGVFPLMEPAHHTAEPPAGHFDHSSHTKSSTRSNSGPGKLPGRVAVGDTE